MGLYPKATKTSMARLLRSKGYELPKIKDALFSSVGHSYFLRWCDLDGKGHQAYYTGASGRPMLMVDKVLFPLTMAEVLKFGLVDDNSASKNEEKVK